MNPESNIQIVFWVHYNYLKSARLLFDHDLYENSVSMSYYTMYNSLTALLFKCGIKCENHAASILLLKKIFDQNYLFKIISFAKKERIDKQYYVASDKNFVLTKESSIDMVKKAEEFLLKMKLVIAELRNEQIEDAREKFKVI